MSKKSIIDTTITAILIDGGFYRKRANAAIGKVSPEERADELETYCKRHLQENINNVIHCHNLYRIFYYDCPPSKMAVYNPVSKNNIELSKTDNYKWTVKFFECLKKKRKFALRLGELANVDDIKESDLRLNMLQKGVDMRIGLDIASLTYKKQVNQIVLISGDSDFVPAAKLARREGVDFVLDPLGQKVKDSLFEHIDGLNIRDSKFKK